MAQSNTTTMQDKKITIEIWSDIVCPFCYLGKKKIEGVIKKLKAEDKVEIIWRSFQLDPSFPKDTSISTNEYLVNRKGYPQAQVNMMTAQLVEQGKQYGIDFKFEKAHSFNTIYAHRLIQWAKEEDKANELKEALMLSYFSNGNNLSIKDSLVSIVKKVGLDTLKAQEILASNDYTENVKVDTYKAQQLGIGGVPYFLINNTAAISGAQNDMVFENAIVNAIKKIAPSGNINPKGVCIPNKECN